MVVHFEPVKVAVLEHRGDPARLSDTVARFIAWRRQSGLSPVAESRTFGIPYGDPATTPGEEFRFDIAGEIVVDVPANRFGVVTKRLAGGRCAVLRHAGSTDAIGETLRYLYLEWLPQSGEVRSDLPVFFHYLHAGAAATEQDKLTDVYLPLV